MAAEPKHRHISRELLSEIAAGRYSPSGRLPSEAQLVKRFAVSRPTVGRALRDLQDQGLIDRRAGSGSYVRAAGSGFPATDRRRLGLLIPGLGTTEIFEAICGELASLARVREYGLLWGADADERPAGDATFSQAEQWCDQFIKQEVAGVFFAPFENVPNPQAMNQQLAERLRQAGITVVLLDRDLAPFPARSDYDLVGVDNFAGGYQVAQHLLKLGCRRLTFVARPGFPPTINARIAGAREAILDSGQPCPASFLHIGDPNDGDFADMLVTSGGADAMVCANDQVAALLLRALQRRGVRVPLDMRLVGFDDVRFAALLSVPLTTVHQPAREIATTAFRAMLERIADPTLPARALTLAPRLVIRESCGAYAQA
jgi:DNA-binding LacI/PurR family transcriptional regulator